MRPFVPPLAILLAAVGGLVLLHGCEEAVAPVRPDLATGALPTLTVTASGSGNGAIASTPGGVSCTYASGSTGTSDCTEAFAAGTSVVLTATPASGSDFVAWDGDCKGTISPCTITMSQDRVVKTFWAKGPYRIAVSGAGAGTGTVSSQPDGITCTSTAGVTTGSDCQEAYPFNTSVTLTAAPAPGHSFAGWSGACTGTGSCIVKSNQSVKTVTASFSGPTSYALTVSGQGQGSGSVTTQQGLTPAMACTITTGQADPTACQAVYPGGTVVTLTAAPAQGSNFSGWSGACTGTQPCQVTLTQALSVVAGFTTSGSSPKATQGEWGPLFSTPVIALHLHLLPTGKVLLWGHAGQPYLWDPAGANPSASYKLVSTSTELFCAGHTFLADGTLLVSGGHISNDHGLPDVNLFNPWTEQWTSLPPMRWGRWYPSSVMLGDGQIVTIAGGAQDGSWVGTPERWTGSSYVPMPGANKTLNYYPRVFLAPNGKIFYAGEDQPSRTLNDPAGNGSWTLGPYLKRGPRGYGSAVLYAPGKILYVGGGNPPTNTAEVMDLNAGTMAWRLVGSMSAARRHHNATLLPDGKVFVNGGTSAPGFNDESGAVKLAEMWDPVTEAFTPLIPELSVRVYHATALLLPDARVLSTGSGDGQGSSQQLNAQIYSPPYLFNPDGSLAARPTITSVNGGATATLHYGQSFSIESPDAASITKGILIRLPSVTHAFSESQAVYPLTWTSSGPTTLSATLTSSSNLVPLGPYMLFVLNAAGVPSVARMVMVAN